MGTDAKFSLVGQDKTKSAFLSVQQNLKGLTNQLTSVQGRIAGLAGAAGFGALVQSSINLADRTGKVAEKLGVTTDQLSRLQFAVGQTSEVTDQQFNIALQRMVRRLEDAEKKGGPLVDQLDSIGLSADRLASLSPDQAFLEIADAMKATTDEGLKVKTAFSLFDSEGVNLVNTLNAGSEALNQLGDEAQRLGVVIDQETAEEAARFNDNLDVLKKSTVGLGVSLASDLLPSMVSVTEAMREGAKEGGLFDAVIAGLNATIQELTATSEIEKINEQIQIAEDQLVATKERLSAATGERGIIAQALEGSDEEKILSLLQQINQLEQSLGRLAGAKANLAAAGSGGGDGDEEGDGINIFSGQTNEETQAQADDLFAINQQVFAAFVEQEKQKTKSTEEETKKRFQLQQQELKVTANLFGSLANLAEAFGKKNSTATKRFAQISAIANTWAGAAKALAEVPYPLNIAAAAAVVANGLAMVKNIENESESGGGLTSLAAPVSQDPSLGQQGSGAIPQSQTSIFVLEGFGGGGGIDPNDPSSLDDLITGVRGRLGDTGDSILPEGGSDIQNIQRL
jgi:hypothetical protein